MLTSITILLTLAFLLVSFALISAIVGLMTLVDAVFRYFSHKQANASMMSAPYADLSGLSL